MLNKYRPRKYEDIHIENKHLLDNYLKQYIDKKVILSNFIIEGNNGIGKTLILKLFLKKYNYKKITIDYNSLIQNYNIKEITSFYFSLSNNNIIDITGKIINNVNKALVFDNLSLLTKVKQKKVIKEILKLNNKYRLIPLFVITTKNEYSKTIAEIKNLVTYKKITNNIIIDVPFYVLRNLLSKILKDEKINLNVTLHEKLLDYSQNDFRKLITNLEKLKEIYNTKFIDDEKLSYYFSLLNKKNDNYNIFEYLNLILDKYDFNRISDIYNNDRTSISLLLHKNYISNIRIQYNELSKQEKLSLIKKISSSLATADKFDGIIYSNQYWNLYSAHCLYSCIIPSYKLNKYTKNSCYQKFIPIDDYSKTSMRKANTKAIKNIKNIFHDKDTTDILYISFIMKNKCEFFQNDTEGNLYNISNEFIRKGFTKISKTIANINKIIK